MSENRMSRRDLVATAAVLPLAAVAAATAAEASNQPNMDAAINYLMQARASLKAATANKGGHRHKAMALIDQAIAEVKLGIQAANS